MPWIRLCPSAMPSFAAGRSSIFASPLIHVEIRPPRRATCPRWPRSSPGSTRSRPSQSLYCAAGSAAGVRTALRDAETFPGGWERSFVVGVRADGEIVAALRLPVRSRPHASAGSGDRGWTHPAWTLAPTCSTAARPTAPSVRGWKPFCTPRTAPACVSYRRAGFPPAV